MLVKPTGGDGNSAYYLPSDIIGTVNINDGEIIELSCPGGTVNLKGASTGLEVAEAVCSSGSSFTVEGQVVPISGITCSRHPFHVARYTGGNCLGDKKEIEVGFELPTRFIRHLTICFDDVEQTSIYSLYDIPKEIGGYQSGYPRPSFIQDDFYSVGSNNVDTLYSRNTQRATINDMLGLSSGDTTYIHASNDYFLSRGHLAAKADFIYGTVQRATFHFVNVAPQWQTNNGGNWNTLEMNVRSFASQSGLDLLVYTGTHGVTTLPHASTGEDIPLYIYNENGVQGLPVPQYYWRVVYDPETQLGTAFVTINNPYHTDVTQEQLCTDVCDQIDWLSWQASDQRLGFSYCCTVDELRAANVPVPDFPVTGLLV